MKFRGPNRIKHGSSKAWQNTRSQKQARFIPRRALETCLMSLEFCFQSAGKQQKCFQQGLICGEWVIRNKRNRSEGLLHWFVGESLVVCIKVVATEVMKSCQTQYVLEKQLTGLDDWDWLQYEGKRKIRQLQSFWSEQLLMRKPRDGMAVGVGGTKSFVLAMIQLRQREYKSKTRHQVFNAEIVCSQQVFCFTSEGLC